MLFFLFSALAFSLENYAYFQVPLKNFFERKIPPLLVGTLVFPFSLAFVYSEQLVERLSFAILIVSEPYLPITVGKVKLVV